MFDKDAFIKSFFKCDAYTLEKLNKGLTNDNYLITVYDQRFVLRVPKSDANQIVNFTHEEKALELAKEAQLDVTTIFYDPTTGIKMTKYVGDLKTYNDYLRDDKLIRVAHLMRRLHSIKKTIGYDFDPIARYHQYRSYVKKPLIDDQSAEKVIQEIKSMPYQATLCHNDWVAGNIGFTQQREYLLDYEYAGDNDPLFDVMSFITENNIPLVDREIFYTAYFDVPLTSLIRSYLKAYEDFHNLLWCTWAMMMYESRQDDIYLNIAYDKLKQFTQT